MRRRAPDAERQPWNDPLDTRIDARTAQVGDGTDLVYDAAALLQWLVAPVPAAEFFSSAWQRAPLHVARPAAPRYHAGWFGVAEMRRVVHGGGLRAALDLDITRVEVRSLAGPARGGVR